MGNNTTTTTGQTALFVQMRQRILTAQEWASLEEQDKTKTTPLAVLGKGELGIEIDASDNFQTARIKAGDGVRTWSALPYINKEVKCEIEGTGNTIVDFSLADKNTHYLFTITKGDRVIPEETLKTNFLLLGGTDSVNIKSSEYNIAEKSSVLEEKDTTIPTSAIVKKYVDAKVASSTQYYGLVSNQNSLDELAKSVGHGDFVRVEKNFGSYHAGDLLIWDKPDSNVGKWVAVEGEDFTNGKGITITTEEQARVISHSQTTPLSSGNYGPTAGGTQASGGALNIEVPQIAIDEFGHVTGVTNKTFAIKDTVTKITVGDAKAVENGAKSDPYINVFDDEQHRGQVQLVGKKATKVSSTADGKISIETLVATSETPGLVKSGTDISVDAEGNVSVNDDSHNHTIDNVDNLQNELNKKYVKPESGIPMEDLNSKIRDILNNALLKSLLEDDFILDATKYE